MKTDIYQVTIKVKGIYHQRYRFIGGVPTKEELLEAIERRLGNSRRPDDANDALTSRTIVANLDIPEIGPLNGNVWKAVGVEIGSVIVEHRDAWTLETT